MNVNYKGQTYKVQDAKKQYVTPRAYQMHLNKLNKESANDPKSVNMKMSKDFTNPVIEKFPHAGRMQYVLKADSKKFGRQEVIVEAFSLNDLLNYWKKAYGENSNYQKYTPENMYSVNVNIKQTKQFEYTGDSAIKDSDVETLQAMRSIAYVVQQTIYPDNGTPYDLPEYKKYVKEYNKLFKQLKGKYNRVEEATNSRLIPTPVWIYQAIEKAKKMNDNAIRDEELDSKYQKMLNLAKQADNLSDKASKQLSNDIKNNVDENTKKSKYETEGKKWLSLVKQLSGVLNSLSKDELDSFFLLKNTIKRNANESVIKGWDWSDIKLQEFVEHGYKEFKKSKVSDSMPNVVTYKGQVYKIKDDAKSYYKNVKTKEEFIAMAKNYIDDYLKIDSGDIKGIESDKSLAKELFNDLKYELGRFKGNFFRELNKNLQIEGVDNSVYGELGRYADKVFRQETSKIAKHTKDSSINIVSYKGQRYRIGDAENHEPVDKDTIKDIEDLANGLKEMARMFKTQDKYYAYTSLEAINKGLQRIMNDLK